jgi:hypothetical protein
MSTATFALTDLDRLAEELNRDGVCVIPGLLDWGLIVEWADAFNALFDEHVAHPGRLVSREPGRYQLALPGVAPFMDERVLANPAVLGVLDRTFAQQYVLVQFAAEVAVPGSEHQEIHRDLGPLFTDQIVTPAYAVTVNFPLVEMTPENGPLQLARGTHVLPRAEGLARIASGEIALESFLLKPGDVLLRSPLALYRSGPNPTRAPRPLISLDYVMHWLHTPRAELTLPREYYDGLPETVRRLLRCRVVDELTAEKVGPGQASRM